MNELELAQFLEIIKILQESNDEFPTYDMTPEESKQSAKTFWKLFD
jgi:hypothetical protein